MGIGKGVTPLQNFARNNASIRSSHVNSAFAEFLGTFIFTLFAVGAGCQSVLFSPHGYPAVFLVPVLGTTIGLMVAITICGGVSGGHINPAVTLGVAISGGISWVKVPIYWISQFFGAYLGAGLAYALYISALENSAVVQGYGCRDDLTNCSELGGVFAPLPRNGPLGIAFLDQVVGTSLLVMIILAACDRRNMQIPTFWYGPLFGTALAGINFTFGVNAGGVLNPARDMGARIMAVSIGFKSSDMFISTSPSSNTTIYYWLAPTFGPLVGGIAAAFIYNFIIAAHLKQKNNEIEEYIPNRFNLRTQISEPEQQQQSYLSSQTNRKYGPTQPPTNQQMPYRGHN